jgi:Domain of unknown function (DUF222)
MATSFVEPLDVDPACLSHDERLTLLERIEHERSALAAQEQRTLALLAREGDAEARAKQWVRDEVAAVLSIAPATAGARLYEAVELLERLPHTFDRLADGSITLLHARVVIDAVRLLDDASVAKLEKRVIPSAQGTPIGLFRQKVKRAVLAIDPRRAEQKHADAAAQRRVRKFADDDGMATIWASLRADQAAGLWDSIEAHARALPDDGRTLEQKRADVLADLGILALNNAPGTWQGQRPAIQVSVALSTLLGIDQQPGELAGYGPIPASLARSIAADSSGTYRRLVTDQMGRLLDYGRTTYRPPAALRDHLIHMYGTCTFPGCRREACKNEIDHITPFPAGPTDDANLHPPCKRHHDLKHRTGWRVAKNYDNAVTWTSPAGRRYRTEPHVYPIDATGDPPPF